MSRRDLIDPESRIPLDALLEAMPGGFNAIPDIVQRRAAVSAVLATLEVPPDPRVTSEDRTVPGPDGEPDVGVRIYRPVDATGPLPAIYYIHGGGMVLGDIAGEDATGGGLAIGTALLARDRGGPALRFLMPIYPMIDERNETPSSHEVTDIGIWDRAANLLDVGTVDLFRDEDIAFAQRLMRAGVPTELHVDPGSYHASEVFAPDAALSKRIWALRIDALRRALT